MSEESNIKTGEGAGSAQDNSGSAGSGGGGTSGEHTSIGVRLAYEGTTKLAIRGLKVRGSSKRACIREKGIRSHRASALLAFLLSQ